MAGGSTPKLEFEGNQSQRCVGRHQIARAGVADSRLEALSLLRYCASWHVVADHFFHNSDEWGKFTWHGSLCCWGLSAVPLFFMLSGFILTYTRLKSRDPDKIDTTYDFFRKRLATIYPIFVFTAACMAAIRLTILPPPHDKVNGQNIANFTSTLLLVHNWVSDRYFPDDFPHMYVDYFLSCIAFYWLFWSSFYRIVVRRARPWMVWTAMSCWWVIPLVHRGVLHQARAEGEGVAHDLIYSRFAFHGMLFVFFNSTPFFFGMLLARAFVDTCTDLAPSGQRVLKDAESMPWPVTHGASIVLALCAILFVSHSPWEPVGGIWLLTGEFWKSGGLLPLQGLLVVSLSAGADPIAKLCKAVGPQYLENLSLPQYLLQVPLGHLLGWLLAGNCDLKTCDTWMIAAFSWALVPTTFFGYTLIVEPGKKFFSQWDQARSPLIAKE